MSRSLSTRYYTRTKRTVPFEGWARQGYLDALSGLPPKYTADRHHGIRTTYARGYSRGVVAKKKEPTK